MVTAVIVGAGHRGFGYACYAITRKDILTIVGVAEPDKVNREKCVDVFQLKKDQVFNSWEELAEKEKLADIAIICTQDRMHKDPAVQLSAKGYHILLEKPMAVNYEDCCEIIDSVKKNEVMFGCCHVLRYYPQYRLMKKLIDDGVIGQICNINHTEPVGFWHFAHSYVRGNWRREDESSCSLLAKCCHDLDLIAYWMGGNHCKRISSFGSLMHFTPENKPSKATNNCLTCPVHKECAFSAQKIYLDRARQGNYGWPVSVVCQATDIEDLEEALKTGPYGRCVYSCDNNVMSNQIVNMQFEDGATAIVNMVALTKRVCARETIISGTKGELRCGFSGPVQEFNFNTGVTTDHKPEFESVPFGLGGHGGADFHLIKTFIDAIIAKDQSKVLAGPNETLYSHHLVFAAEKARLENRVVQL